MPQRSLSLFLHTACLPVLIDIDCAYALREKLSVASEAKVV